VSKSGNQKNQTNAATFVPEGGALARSGKKKKSWLPFIGVMLVLAGVVFIAATSGIAAAKWLLGLWPLFAIIAGVAGVMGFAVERKPKSPVGGMLLIFFGVLFFAGRFHSNLNALQIYGRYWLVLLFIYASVELIRFYSHRQNEGAPPRLFSFGKLFMVMLIVGSGVVANRVAVNNPSVLASLKLPAFFSSVRDSVIGERYTFTDEAIPISGIKPNTTLTINNSKGNVQINGGATTPRAYLVKDVRAWKKDDALEISDKIKLLINQAPDGSLTISTNRDEINNEINHEFNTHIQIDVPANLNVTVTNSYGTVTASHIQGGVTVKSSYGRVEANDIGNANFNLNLSEVNGTTINGSVTVTGAKSIKLADVKGSVTANANNGSVDLRRVSGIVKIESSYRNITLQDLQESATIKTNHGNVQINNAANVNITAPFTEINASNIKGDLQIESSNDEIRATSVSGDIIIKADRADITAEDILGDVNISNAHGEVSVKNFHQGVTVESTYRDILLTTSEAIVGEINVQNSHGEIRMVLPSAGSFHLDAESEKGQVKAKGFDDFFQMNKSSMNFVKGTNGPLIKLRTTYRDIIVQASGLRQAQTNGVVKPPSF
jgi:uncharacterized membrane protein HdeD (DUF308 family)